MADIARRFDCNPLLRPRDVMPTTAGMTVECLLNPGVFRHEGLTWLLMRVAERPKQKPGKTSFPILRPHGAVEILEFDNEDPKLDLSDPRVITYDGKDYLTTMSHLRLVASRDGMQFGEPEAGTAALKPILGDGEYESFGIEDARVAKIGDIFYVTYTQVSENGVGVGMLSTTSWQTLQAHGMILPPHNKDCAIFEERIGGMYYALHRPSSPELGGNYIWIAESPDLEHWGGHRCIAQTRPGSWDSARVGAGASPIRTERGWLEIYHGATAANRYCLGALLLDLERPWQIIARSDEPIMEPREPYEKNGFFGEVIFTNGHVVDGDEVIIYYGASDSVICGARFSIRKILASLRATGARR